MMIRLYFVVGWLAASEVVVVHALELCQASGLQSQKKAPEDHRGLKTSGMSQSQKESRRPTRVHRMDHLSSEGSRHRHLFGST